MMWCPGRYREEHWKYFIDWCRSTGGDWAA